MSLQSGKVKKAVKIRSMFRNMNSVIIIESSVLLTGMAHVDYTAESGVDRLDALLPEEADKLRKTPFAVVQVHSRANLYILNLALLDIPQQKPYVTIGNLSAAFS